jgi:Ice-binding-like
MPACGLLRRQRASDSRGAEEAHFTRTRLPQIGNNHFITENKNMNITYRAGSLIGQKLSIGAILLGAVLAACSSASTPGTSGTPGASGAVSTGHDSSKANNTGSIGLAFSIPDSITIVTISYTVTGPTNVSGTVDVSQAMSSVEFVVGPLLAGPGYTITLTGTDTAGDTCASVPTPFSIAVGLTTQAIVDLVCTVGGGFTFADSGTGSLEIEAPVTTVTDPTTTCPVVAGIFVSPAEEVVGATSTVVVTTAPPGSPVTCTVTTTDAAGSGTGTVSVTSTGATFTCTSPGQVLLTASTTAPLANNAGNCPPQSMSAYINCEPPSVVSDAAVASDATIASDAAIAMDASSSAGPSLGSAASFAILGASTVTCTNQSAITGDVGVSPGTAITGFNPSCTTTGTIHAGDAVAAQAHTDLGAAYGALTADACPHNLTGQDLGGQTLAPGVYCFNTTVGLTGALTLDGGGDSSATWIFQVGTAITTGSGSSVVMAGSGKPGNVFWQVGSSATIATGTAFQGNILASASITLVSGSRLVGRALALNAAVTSDNNAVSLPQ